MVETRSAESDFRAAPWPSPAELGINSGLVARMLTGFVRNEVRKVGFERVILGLSGGVDSSVVAYLAQKALGAANVLGVIMPYRTSSPQSVADARLVAADLGLETEIEDITASVDAYFGRHPEAESLRRGNKMARERMSILYDLSVARNALVLGTSNKTELLLGYGTLFGDMASALNPLGDLYKTQVWQLAEALGVPSGIVAKPPSADLWPDQTDEAELGIKYEDADRILFCLVDYRLSAEQVVERGFPADLVARVVRRLRDNQYKRLPPILAKISQRTIGQDFRYPRDWGR